MNNSRFALAAILVLTVAACGAKKSGDTQASPAATTVDAVEQTTTETAADTGGRYFRQRCAVCHTVTDPAIPGHFSSVGPSLFGVFGAHVAHQPGFSYSPALLAADITWNDETLDTWIANPQKFVPGNRMAFAGEPDAQKRADIIAYLKTLK